MILDDEFWEDRYSNKQTGWDTGGITSPLKAYFDQLTDKTIRILIPGCGNAYEAEYLFHKGFKYVFLADIAASPLRNFKQRVPEFPEEQLLHQDFFKLDKKFDLIVEQTFFCAIDPELRTAYARQAAALLNENGKLVGLLFNTLLNTDKPPFGGSREEYLKYFEPYFDIRYFETSTNSIKPREGSELFILLEKKKAAANA